MSRAGLITRLTSYDIEVKTENAGWVTIATFTELDADADEIYSTFRRQIGDEKVLLIKRVISRYDVSPTED